MVAAFDGPWSSLPSPPQPAQVGVYLFVWYQPTGTGWGNGSTVVPAGAPRPTLGWYDSSNTKVLYKQMADIAAAGFDFVIVDLPADNERIWRDVTILYKAASAYPLKVAVMLDGLYREPPEVQRAALQRVRDQFGRHPNAMQLDGKPLVLFFSSFAPAGIEDITLRNVYWSPEYRNGLNPFYRGRTPSSPTYPLDWPFWAPHLPAMVNGVVPILPGYDDRLLGRPVSLHHPRDDGRLYADQWEQALRLRPDIITVYSWNEHFEGTAIEPTDVWGDLYLGLTRNFIRRAHGAQP